MRRLVLAALLTLAPSLARAQDAAQASFHDARGRDHYRAGRFSEAARELFVVQTLAPSPANLFNLALCFDQLERASLATYYFSAYLASEDDDPARRRVAGRALERLHPKVARLRVQTDPPGAEVFVDHLEHGSYGKTPVTVPVAPGAHELWIRADGFTEVRTRVDVEKGKVTPLSLDLARIVGHLEARVTPPADILVLDANEATVARGHGHARIALPPGVYLVEATPAGHRRARTAARVTAEAATQVELQPEALPPPTGQLVVTANRLGALVELDGEPVGFTPAVLPAVPEGRHTVRLSAPDVEAWQAELEVKAEARGFLTASLEAPRSGLPPTSAWVAGGLGAAALIAAAVVGGVAAAHHDDFATRYAAGPGEDLTGLRDEGRRLNATADGLLVGGLVAVAVGALLYGLDEGGEGSSANLSWQEGP